MVMAEFGCDHVVMTKAGAGCDPIAMVTVGFDCDLSVILVAC